MRISKTILILIMGINSFACTNQDIQKTLITEFIQELRTNKSSTSQLIKKFFILRDDVTQEDLDEAIIPLLKNQFDLLKERINTNCKLEIIKHNDQLKSITNFSLSHTSYDNVFYLTCDDGIIAPFLIQENKIVSITVYSKNENGSKKFMMY